VKCTTQFYNQSAYGPGPIVTSQISVYTHEENKMEVGEKLIHLVQNDIHYKREGDTRRGKYRYKNSDFIIGFYYYNNGNPSTTLEGENCFDFTDDREDIWNLNIVES